MYNDRTPGDDPPHKVISTRPVDADSILIDSPELMFSGSYSRDGNSLVIEGINGNGLFQKLVVDDFFGGEQVGLVAPNGALLNFDTVSTLAGPETPGQYAATGSAGATLVKIGEVIKLEGSANSKKVDGIEGELKVGDPVYQGDTITTGPATKLGITFIDDTVFSMSENATMVLDELVYKGPGNSDNSMIMNLVQGTFVFVTGEVAPSGNMTVETPIATMGIRGTTPKVTVDTNLGVGEFSILPDPNGEIGSYVLLDKNTGAILGQVESTDSKWVVTSLTGEAVEIGKSAIDLFEDSAALDEIRDLISRALGDRTELDGANSFGQIGFDSLSSGGPGPGGLEGVDDAIDGIPIAGDGVEGEPGDPPIAEDEAFFTGEDPLLLGEDVVIGTGGGPDFDPDGFVVLITQVNGIDLVFVGDVASVLLPSGAILLVSATGGITYDPNGAYDFLGLDDVDADIFQYTIEDPEGFTDVATVTVTLTGSNDQPEITNTALTMHSDAFTEAGDTGNTTTTRTAMGNVSFTDIDASDTHTSTVSAPLVTHTQDGGVTQVLGPIGNIAINLTETAADPAPVLQFAPDGTLISRPPPVTGNVAWTYTVQENELDFLAEGETLELVYTITIIDDSGVGAGTVADEPQTVTQDVVVTITGTNDVPQITAGVVTGTISDINEDATVPPQNDAGLQTTTGSLDFTDADLTDRPVATEETVSVELIAQDGVTPLVLTTDQMTAIEDAFSIAPDGVSGPNTNNGTINWTYSIAEAELDFLGAGEVVTATFLITVTDDEGATATQTVVITILGADDDAPVITPVVITGSVSDVAEGSAVPPTANAGALETSGSITFSDVDLTDRPTASEATTSVVWLAADGVTPIALSAGQMTAIENAFSITPDGVSGANTNDGTIDWTYLIQEADVDFLAAGETVTAVFTITVTDDEGNTDTQDITITINGANDTPFITATTDVGETLAETDAGLMTTGEFDVSDVDTSDVVSITGVAVAVSGNTSDPAYPG
ncbi:MAG: VCBS domain-containing protein, partial [Pseudomonadota bacterium]